VTTRPDAAAGLGRRAFLGLCSLAGIAHPAFAEALWRKAAPAGSGPAGPDAQARITVEMVAAAEQVIGLEFTPAEREMLVQDLNGALAGYASLHAVSIPNAVPPAVRFDPEAPGVTALPPAGPALRLADTRRRDRPARPAADDELAFLPVTALAELVRARVVTSTELTRLYLDRLRRHDPTLLCVTTLTEERALAQARRADGEIASGRWRGPLHGIPWGAKDLLAVPGYPTTWGSPIYRDRRLDETATVVRKLDEAGAVLVAKLTLGELAMGDVWYGGMTRNPWKADQGSSGSSAGSAAAVAAGLVGFAIGTETLGSIVSPSTRCGATGLRPTFGRVSRHGAMALSWTMDKVGPICRSAQDCGLVLRAIHGADGLDPTAVDRPFRWDPGRGLEGIRVGYLKAAFDADHQTKAFDDAALEALRSAGVALVPVDLDVDLPVPALRIILSAEAAAAFDELTRTNEDDRMVRQVRGAWPGSFRAARFIPAVEYIQANRIRTMVMRRVDEVLRQVDVIVAPSFGGNVLLTTNLTGHPTLVVPNGFNPDGTPVSLSFVGRLWGESDVLAVGRAYQEATGFHLRRPPGLA
jgi:Asp-tRNA(Asn)/Glu-tRNA(Gln) amidotransferase A subunit family amidase